MPNCNDVNSLLWRLAIQSHSAHETRPVCSALTTLAIRANGDVLACSSQRPMGNIRRAQIGEIWRTRPRWWEAGCRLDNTLSGQPQSL
jgi:MoaA/NifB/PqqE/SkfB family radical SAM enzyme